MRISCLVFVVLVGVSSCLSQDNVDLRSASWRLSPTLSLTKYLPGTPVVAAPTWGIYQPGLVIGASSDDFRYSATGLDFSVRCYHEAVRNLALTFGSGVRWFYSADLRVTSGTPPVAPANEEKAAGIGEMTQPGDFMVFPIAVGVQAVFPYDQRDLFMVFGGVEGNVNFISGDIPRDQQAKLGYAIVGGFAVRVFEFGIRYSEISDLKNLGAYFGFRLNSITL
jgi:hypothetical protein